MSVMKPLQVITSGAFAAALKELTPIYIAQTGEDIALHFGSSLGAAQDSIPTRLLEGQTFDIFILARQALNIFAAGGHLASGAGWDLVESNIGMAVKANDPAPDISTLEAFKYTLLNARRIALAASASGIYLSDEVFPKLEITGHMKKTAFTVFGERVGHVIARGEADIGFQQVSEILPIKTVKLVGMLPDEIRTPFFFSAALGADCAKIDRALNFLRFVSSSDARDIVRTSGLVPLSPVI